jgi:hypothetical protein
MKEADNHVRLNSAIGYITPKDMLAGRHQEIQVDRHRNWKRRENTGRIAASGTGDRRNGLLPGGTIQPELMDACLDWMACISIDASWLLS